MTTRVPSYSSSISSSCSQACRSRWFVGSSRRRRFTFCWREACELQPALLAARERADLAVEVLAGEEEAVQERLGVGLEEARRLLHPVAERHAAVEGLSWSLRVLAHDDALAEPERGVLPADPCSRGSPEQSVVLPAAVGADEADALAELHLEVRPFEDRAVAVGVGEVLDDEGDASAAVARGEFRRRSAIPSVTGRSTFSMRSMRAIIALARLAWPGSS